MRRSLLRLLTVSDLARRWTRARGFVSMSSTASVQQRLHRRIACRHCHGATYASRTLSKNQRPVLQVSRLQSFLNSQLYQRTRDKLTKKLGHKAMMTQSKYQSRARNI
jgi:hypothetical protein